MKTTQTSHLTDLFLLQSHYPLHREWLLPPGSRIPRRDRHVALLLLSHVEGDLTTPLFLQTRGMVGGNSNAVFAPRWESISSMHSEHKQPSSSRNLGISADVDEFFIVTWFRLFALSQLGFGFDKVSQCYFGLQPHKRYMNTSLRPSTLNLD